MSIKAVLFDFDGTLTVQGGLDFGRIREAVGCPATDSILSFIEKIEDSQAREEAERVLADFERDAASRALPNDGAEELIERLKRSGYRVGILTRNSLDSVLRSFANFRVSAPDDFDCIITRDDDVEVKPAPAGVLRAAKAFGVAPPQVLVVGDYIYDIEAGNAAGSVTAFLDNHPDRTFEAPESHYTISRLEAVYEIVQTSNS